MDFASSRKSRKIVRRVVFAGCGVVIAALAVGPLVGRAIGAAEIGPKAHSAKLTSLGLKFDGAESCKGSKCHSKGDSAAPPTERGNENDIWSGADPHSKAYDTLKNDESKAIVQKMGLGADATAAADCLACHALDLGGKDSLKGKDFNIAEGNTCVSCHGPSEKWLEPHATKPWTDDQRKAHPDHEALFKATGLYDTRPLMARAELCTSCHLAIDAKMVAAGHPQPKFELHYYTEFNASNENAPWKHWTTDEGKLQIAKVWLSGQAAATSAAMSQLAARATAKESAESIQAAFDQAVSHGALFAVGAKAAGLGDMTAAVAAVQAAKGDAGKLASTGAEAAGAASKMFGAVGSFQPTEAQAKAMLGAVAGWKSAVTDAGADGHAQAAFAVYALASAVATNAGQEQAAVDEMVGPLFPDPSAPADAAAFEKALAEVAAKLPK